MMPLPDKVEAIKIIAVPTTKKQFWSFIGLINYYRDVCKHISGFCTLLSSMTSKQAKWNWRKEYQKTFDTIKKIVSRETLLYANFNKSFVIHTYVSKLLSGAVISQYDKPIIFYSKKQNSPQVNYTTTVSYVENRLA